MRLATVGVCVAFLERCCALARLDIHTSCCHRPVLLYSSYSVVVTSGAAPRFLFSSVSFLFACGCGTGCMLLYDFFLKWYSRVAWCDAVSPGSWTSLERHQRWWLHVVVAVFTWKIEPFLPIDIAYDIRQRVQSLYLLIILRVSYNSRD